MVPASGTRLRSLCSLSPLRSLTDICQRGRSLAQEDSLPLTPGTPVPGNRGIVFLGPDACFSTVTTLWAQDRTSLVLWTTSLAPLPLVARHFPLGDLLRNDQFPLSRLYRLQQVCFRAPSRPR